MAATANNMAAKGNFGTANGNSMSANGRFERDGGRFILVPTNFELQTIYLIILWAACSEYAFYILLDLFGNLNEPCLFVIECFVSADHGIAIGCEGVYKFCVCCFQFCEPGLQGCGLQVILVGCIGFVLV